MTSYAAFLRGINVGGNRRIKMADLRAALGAAGLDGAQTLLQSGNVLLESNAGIGSLTDIVETTIQEAFGFAIHVIVRTDTEMRELTESAPFSESQLSDGRMAQVAFCKDEPDEDGYKELRSLHDGPEELSLIGRELFVFYPEGSGRSKLTYKRIESYLGAPATARNWNTVTKVVEQLSR